jgi:plastocyanin
MKVQHLTLSLSLLALMGCGGGGGSSTPTTPVTPAAPKLATIRLPSANVSLAAGEITTLAPVALDASGAAIAGATGYTYSSGTTTVAETQASGGVIGISAGNSVITVSLTRDGVTATATTTVAVTGTLPATATVAAGASDQTFTPPTLVVARNASVTYSFGALTHNVTYRTATGAPTNVPNSASTTVARVFPTAGDFTYDCTIHAGMTGMVMVR